MHGGLHAGLPPVSACLRDPVLIKLWGVEKSAIINSPDGIEIEVPLIQFEWDGAEYDLYRHPMLYISEDVRAWNKSYVASEYTTRDKYVDSNYLWFDALNIYKQAFEKYKQKG